MSEAAIVLLGSAAGIGGACLERCAREWPDRPVYVTYADNPEAATALLEQIGRGRAVHCDASRPDGFDALHASLKQDDVVVSVLLHAMVAALPGGVLDVADRLSRAIDVSAVSLARVVVQLDDLWRSGSSIIYLTSVGSTRVVPGYAAVGVAKAAGESLVRYLASELGPRGVRVNAVGSGPVATAAFEAMFGAGAAVARRLSSHAPLVPAPGVDEVANAVLFLSGDGALGVTGQVLTVDGGLFLA